MTYTKSVSGTVARPSQIADPTDTTLIMSASKLDWTARQLRPGESMCAVLYYEPAADLSAKKIQGLIIESCDTQHYNCRVRLGYESLVHIVRDRQITCLAPTPCRT